MLGEQREILAAKAESVFQLRTKSEGVHTEAFRHLHRLGNIAARPPPDAWRAANHARHRIIGKDMDFAVVHKGYIRHALKSCQCVLKLISNGFIGQIGAGHNERVTELSEYQQMKR